MRTLGFAVAFTLVAGTSHAGDLWRDRIHDDTVLLAFPLEYEPALSACELMLRQVVPNRTAEYLACRDAEAEKSRVRALRELAWPNQPGRH